MRSRFALIATARRSASRSARRTARAGARGCRQRRLACAGSAGRAPLGAPAMTLNAPLVGIASNSNGTGYWLLAQDGGIFSYGTAQFHGSTGAMHLNQPVVGIAATPNGHGYWLVASDGGIFTFGNARFHGSTGAMHLNSPIVGMASTPNGRGYWLVAADGGIFSFGDARFHGSTGALAIGSPVVGIDEHGRAAAATGSRPPTGTSSTSATRGRCTRSTSSSPIVGLARDAKGTGLLARREQRRGLHDRDRDVLRRRQRPRARSQAVGIARRGRPRLLDRDRARRAAAPAQLRHRPPHRVLEHAAAHVARRGQRRGLAHVPGVGPPRASRGRASTTCTRRCRRLRRAT